MTASPIERTKHIYSSFARGDIEAIIVRLAPDVQWEYGYLSHDVPWYQNQHGIEGVRKFFQSLQAVEFQRFEPTAFLGEGDTVVVLLNAEYTVRNTGKRVIYEDAVMLWKFNAEGKVTKFAHRVDAHQAWLAFHGRDGVSTHRHLTTQSSATVEHGAAAARWGKSGGWEQPP